ncbi:hypothetical protein ACFWP0_25810 [Achromobacter sp. NPDC058515]|uniref:hypothetical protein n=1 Tax=Achromobacter sp. NPDC058515 TaxID=3346533 RepID=UPI00365035CC
MQTSDRQSAARFTGVMGALVAILGAAITIWLAFIPGGSFPSLKPVLIGLAAGATNLLCLPFVAAHWYLAGKPAGVKALLGFQTLGALATVWYYVALT